MANCAILIICIRKSKKVHLVHLMSTLSLKAVSISQPTGFWLSTSACFPPARFIMLRYLR